MSHTYFDGASSMGMQYCLLNSHQINGRSWIMYSADVSHDGFSETSVLRAIPKRSRLYRPKGHILSN